MSGEMELRRGDVVTVRVDSIGNHGAKRTRPAVVVQNDVGNEHASTTVVAPVTGTQHGYPFEVPVEAGASPLDEGSSIRLDQVRVVSIDKRVRSVDGSLDGSTMAAVDDALELSLGLG